MLRQLSFLLLCMVPVVHCNSASTEYTPRYNRLSYFSTLNDFLNTCPEGNNHLKRPQPQPDLFKQCSPWRNRSCCSGSTTKSMHLTDTWYNFNWNHCPGHTLSDTCRRHFMQDLCFYECSPNVGPWLVMVNSKFRKERFVNVPLCKSDCDNWWNDCKDDYTCRDNWARGFNWTTGTNRCPRTSSCHPFKLHFKTAKRFCERIWDGSFKVVPDSEPCMKMWFKNDNPNDRVARLKAQEIIRIISASSLPIVSMVLNMLTLFFVVLL